MLCSLCRRHGTKNKYNKSTIWCDTPCISLRKDCVRRHESSIPHQNAVEVEIARLAAERDGGIAQAFEKDVSLHQLHLILMTAIT